jgi:maltoporin
LEICDFKAQSPDGISVDLDFNIIHRITRMKTKTGSLPFLFIAVIVSLVVPASPPASAQTATNSEVDAIRKEMQEMRADYERRMDALEKRLEQAGSAKTNGGPEVQAAKSQTGNPTNTVPPESERGQAFANLQFDQHGATRESVMAQPENAVMKQRIEQVLNDFMDTAGYFRAGYGRDDKGGPQPAFQAPGAFAKYRLGNEAENYGELMLGKNWYVPDMFSTTAGARPDGTPTGPIARTQVRVAFYDPYSSSGGNSTDVTLPEAWASIGNVFAGQPSVKFWAGERFYRRQDIHIDDFFFYNMSGAGGGVEDWELPNGKLALAWIGNGQQSGIYSSDIAALPDPNNLAGFSKQSWDLSYYDVEVPLGKAEFGAVFALENSGKDSNGVQADNSEGVAFTFIHSHEHFLSDDGVNKFSLQFGTGAAKTFTSGYETTVLTNGTFIVPDDSHSWRFRATESFVSDITPHFSIGPALVYQYTDYHTSQGNVQWISGGVRPIYHFNKNFDIAFEGGVDHVHNQGPDPSGTLYKFTIAPEVTLANKFMSRPVLRAFVTYAQWTDDFKGSVGGNDYMNNNNGWVWGIQMESWW